MWRALGSGLRRVERAQLSVWSPRIPTRQPRCILNRREGWSCEGIRNDAGDLPRIHCQQKRATTNLMYFEFQKEIKIQFSVHMLI